ncbi:TPA: glycosyltransferase [Vibrio parahaemolyticus]|nr:glycosyltransferase [Vibrio parahaemolyticus]
MKNKVVIVQNSIKSLYGFRNGYIRSLTSSDDKLEIVAIAPIDCDISKSNLEKMGVKVFGPRRNNGWFNLVLCSLVMNYYVFLNSFKAKRIICHFLVTYLLCYPSFWLSRGSHILFVEGLGSFFSSKFKIGLFTKLLKLSNPVMLYCNEHERNTIGLAGYVTGGIGVDLEYFSYSPFKSSKSFELLYVGRLIRDKGVLDAIEVLRMLKAKNYSVNLTLVGDIYPNNPSSLTEDDVFSLKNEFGNCLRFCGFTPDVREFYKNCHALILPSKLEGFPVCVMEASSVGRPSFVYNVPGCSDAVLHGINGFTCEFGDLNKLTLNVEGFINKFNSESEIAISSRNYAELNFSRRIKDAFICSKLLE